MENDSPEVIQERMQRTRNSLTDKVAQLEEQVMGTVQTATDAVQSTVDAVKETVDEVRSSVQDSVMTVTDTVKKTFDVSTHVRDNPWAAVGISIAAGFLTGRFVFGRTERGTEHGAPVSRFAGPSLPSTPVASPPSDPSWLDRLVSRAGDELFNLGEQALNQTIDALRQTVDQGVPRLISEVEHRLTGNGRSKSMSYN